MEGANKLTVSGIDKQLVGQVQQTFVVCVSPIPTRVRVFATQVSTSAAKVGKAVSKHGYQVEGSAALLRRHARIRKYVSEGTAARHCARHPFGAVTCSFRLSTCQGVTWHPLPP